MPTRKKENTVNDFYCTKCGKRGIPLVRKAGKQKEQGHLKNLFCIYCQEETNHVELRPFGSYRLEDFLEEFELGRFVDGKRIAKMDLENCKNKECKYYKNGKCWNSNHSYDCEVRNKNDKNQ